MTKQYLLGVDIGTTGSKGVITNLRGKVLAYRFVEHGVATPKPGWCEQDADAVWWGDLALITRDLVASSGVDPSTIAAVGISAHCPDMLPLDAEGRPLRAGMLYSDNRASQEIRDITTLLGAERIAAVSGRPLTPDSVGAKIVWLREHEPRLFERTRWIHSACGYLVFRLTGEHVLDYATASPRFSPMYNVHTMAWDSAICAEVGIDPQLLPRLQWGTEIAGELTAQAARETGLAEGTPVITGACDALAEAVGSSAVGDGEASLLYGTTMVMFAMCKATTAGNKALLGPAAMPGVSRVVIGMSASGALTRWFRDNLGQVEREAEAKLGIDAYQLLSEGATGVPAGSEGLVVLPYFAGERSPIYDAQARGLILGLTLSHTRCHIYRALLEGTAYGLRHGLEGLLEAGIELRRIVATGGGTRGKLWPQIVSDVIGYDQEIVASPYGAPLGDAFLAGFGAGIFSDLSPLQQDWVQTTSVMKANPRAKALYDRYYRVYHGLYETLRSDMHELVNLSCVMV